MASKVDLDPILEIRYPSFTAEVNAFLDSCQVSASPEIAAQIISDAIKSDTKVWDNLKLLYHKAAYGQDKRVKKRIFNRITHFRRTLQFHPKVKNLDMLHATDYSNMGLEQMEKKVADSKAVDSKISKSMQKQYKMSRKEKKDKNVKAEIIDDDAYWCEEEDCWKSKVNDDNAETEVEEDDDTSESDECPDFPNEQHEMNMKLVLKAANKKSCVPIDNPRVDVTGPSSNAGPCSKEYLEAKAAEKFCGKMDEGDLVFDVDEDARNDVASAMKTSGNKAGSANHKKLAPPKQPVKRQLPDMTSKAEKQFDDLVQKSKIKELKTDGCSDAEKQKQKQLEDLKESFSEPANAKRAKLDEKEEEILDEIKRCTQKVGKSSVETTAYLRALGKYKGLDMDKYRDQVEKEVKDDAKGSKDTEDSMQSDGSELVPDETELYQNQLSDPQNSNYYFSDLLESE